MSSVSSPAGVIYAGMDVSKNVIVIAVLGERDKDPRVSRVANEQRAVAGFFAGLGGRGRVEAVYEAGPGGFDLCRLLRSAGVEAMVTAPSLIPKGRGDKVKTDRRDAVRLARLLRAGELTAVRVPPLAQEAVRDLVRVRAALLADRKRAQQRLTAMLMRHGRIWRDGSYWTLAHRRWVAAQRFDEPAMAQALAHYRAAVELRETELAAAEAQLLPWAAREPLAGPVRQLCCYRGIAELGALTMVAETGDWRRFGAARSYMCFTGLVPSEYSSGERTRRGHITKAGSDPLRQALTEAAWAYQHKPAIGAGLARRQDGAAPATLARSWKAQQRLHGRYAHLVWHSKKAPGEAITAVARELAGFVWAEMTA